MTFDVEIAARTCWGEARNQTDEGIKAVAWVIINRFHAKKWYSGQTLAETAMFCVKGSKYHQFSCWNTDDPNRALMLRVAEDNPALQKCRKLVGGALNGDIGDPTQGCTHYKRKDVDAVWAKGKIPVIRIGDHDFYRGIA